LGKKLLVSWDAAISMQLLDDRFTRVIQVLQQEKKQELLVS
jgi:phosphorylcholine metabolism protein LicD